MFLLVYCLLQFLKLLAKEALLPLKQGYKQLKKKKLISLKGTFEVSPSIGIAFNTSFEASITGCSLASESPDEGSNVLCRVSMLGQDGGEAGMPLVSLTEECDSMRIRSLPQSKSNILFP